MGVGSTFYDLVMEREAAESCRDQWVNDFATCRTILFYGKVNHVDGNGIKIDILTESITSIEIRETNISI